MKKLVVVQETSQGRYLNRVLIELTPWCRSTLTWEDEPTCSWLTWNPKIHIFTRLPLADFYLVFLCFAIVWENTLFYLILILFYTANYLEFLDWREDPRLFRDLYWIHCFLPYLSLHYIHTIAMIFFAMSK